MRVFTAYLYLEIKRGLYLLPRILAGTILLGFLLGGIGFFASHSLYARKDAGKVPVALALPEGEDSVRWMLSVLEEMDSVRENILFLKTYSQDEALSMLQEGKAAAAVLVPAGFVSGILEGTNQPARIILPKGAALESRLIKALTEAGAETLGAAQAGIYSVSHFFWQEGETDAIPAMETALNTLYLDYAMPRKTLFDYETVQATGKLKPEVYFLFSGLLLFLFLWGMTCPPLFTRNQALEERLLLLGLSKYHRIGIKILSVFLILLLILCLPGLPLFFLSGISAENLLRLFPCLLFVVLGVASWIVFFYSLGRNSITGALLLFTAAIGMAFLSGGFVPAVFLPKEIQMVGSILPSGLFASVLGAAYMGELPVYAYLLTALYSMTAFFLSVLLEGRRKAGVSE